MRRRRVRQRLDWKWIGGTTLVSAAALAVFFVLHGEPSMAVNPTETPDVDMVNAFDDEEAYYNNEADNFLRSMPSDKSVVACRIDADQHYVCYTESTDMPSCYVYDLETCTTKVLFSGSEGVDCGQNRVYIKSIDNWRTRDNRIVFIVQNGDEQADYTNRVAVFVADIENASFALVDYGSDAYFNDEKHVTVIKAALQYRSFFTNEDVYTKSPLVYKI